MRPADRSRPSPQQIAPPTHSCLQRAINKHGLTAEQLADAWMAGGHAFEDLVLGFNDVATTLHGEYLKRRGGLPAKGGRHRVWVAKG